jgi:hypothetical protein
MNAKAAPNLQRIDPLDPTMWTVCWRYQGRDYVFDSDDRSGAHEFAAKLSEGGRRDVRVLGSTFEVPEDVMAAVRKRVSDAVYARLQDEAIGLRLRLRECEGERARLLLRMAAQREGER